jgi:hypothetical protein
MRPVIAEGECPRYQFEIETLHIEMGGEPRRPVKGRRRSPSSFTVPSNTLKINALSAAALTGHRSRPVSSRPA